MPVLSGNSNDIGSKVKKIKFKNEKEKDSSVNMSVNTSVKTDGIKGAAL